MNLTPLILSAKAGNESAMVRLFKEFDSMIGRYYQNGPTAEYEDR